MSKGFTLIELLVVIAIVAVLAVAVVLVLNPAQLIMQGRDATRISDLATVQSAIVYYLSTAASPYISAVGRTAALAGAASPYNNITASCTVTGTNWFTGRSRGVNGIGWVAVSLTQSSGGSPLGNLPVDPTNSTTYFYGFCGDSTNTTFELDAKLESTKYTTTQDLDGLDGGDQTDWYEIGNDPRLDL